MINYNITDCVINELKYFDKLCHSTGSTVGTSVPLEKELLKQAFVVY